MAIVSGETGHEVEVLDTLEPDVDLDFEDPDEADERPAPEIEEEPETNDPRRRSKGWKRFAQLANENQTLKERLARTEGAVDALTKQRQLQPEPELKFDDPDEEARHRVIKQLKALGEGQNNLRQMLLEEKQAAANERAIRTAMQGMTFKDKGDASVVQRNLERALKSEPGITSADLRTEAKDLYRRMGGKAKDYVDGKRAAAGATARTQAAGPRSPSTREEPKNYEEMRGQAQTSALQRLAAARKG